MFTKDNSSRLKRIYEFVGSKLNKRTVTRLKFALEKIVLRSSHTIFKQKDNNEWIKPSYILEDYYESLHNNP